MKGYQVREGKYKRRGIEDFLLRNDYDLAEILDIYVDEIVGYTALNDFNKSTFEEFLVNFYNGWGLEARTSILPKRVFIAEEHFYVVGDEQVGYELWNVTDKDNSFIVVEESIDYSKCKGKDVVKTTKGPYLRFEYVRVCAGTSADTWLHVDGSNKYY